MEQVQNTELMKRVEQAREGLRFSAHAETRLKSRGIDFGSEMMKRLETAVDRAEKKGVQKDSLVLMKDLALIVNIKNRTVITAMDQNNMKESVFTNIESAVIA